MKEKSVPGCSGRAGMQLATLLIFAVALVFSVPGSAVIGAENNPGTAAAPDGSRLETAVLAGGCFWGVDAVFKHVQGVTKVVSGYAGGNTARPSYEEVSSGTTGHAESVDITFNPQQVSYAQLLKVFFLIAHDPTELNRQGPDEGSQYRSAVFYENPRQKKTAEEYIAQLARQRIFPAPIVTRVVALQAFYPAEDYHQNYFAQHPYSPYILINDRPKLVRLREKFPELYRP